MAFKSNTFRKGGSSTGFVTGTGTTLLLPHPGLYENAPKQPDFAEPVILKKDSTAEV